MFNFFSEIKKEVKMPDVVDGYNLVNVNGKIIYVEGHKGILSLTDELVTIKVKNKIISILGKNLMLKNFSPKTITIVGEVRCVEVI